jgi:acetoin utilization protein AcuA
VSGGVVVRDLPAGDAPAPLHPDLDVFRPPDRQRDALAAIAAEPRGRVLVAERAGRTVGYLTFHPPDPVERWGGDRSGRLIELGAIEVAPDLRGAHLGERLLEAAFADGAYDDTVVFAALYAWHYDLERTGLGPLGYRRLLERLYRGVGLERVPTRDPEIGADPANALLARVGPHAPDGVRDEFERLRTLPPAG